MKWPHFLRRSKRSTSTDLAEARGRLADQEARVSGLHAKASVHRARNHFADRMVAALREAPR